MQFKTVGSVFPFHGFSMLHTSNEVAAVNWRLQLFLQLSTKGCNYLFFITQLTRVVTSFSTECQSSLSFKRKERTNGLPCLNTTPQTRRPDSLDLLNMIRIMASYQLTLSFLCRKAWTEWAKKLNYSHEPIKFSYLRIPNEERQKK
jgi:hypothetical protein